MKQAQWRMLAVLMLVLGMSFGGVGVWSLTGACADNGATSRTSRSSAKESGAADEARIERKLKQILENQEKILENQAAILQQFDLIMEELRIIKVRATLRGG